MQPSDLLANNRTWVEAQLASDPAYFNRLARGQSPDYLLFGCSDSRKCPNLMVGASPGDLFVHRNIGNQAPLSDTNVQAVLEYAVLTLAVKHIVVAGHTRCGGMAAALDGGTRGALSAWLRPVRDLVARHEGELLGLSDPGERADRLSEINVVAQVENVLGSAAMREARGRGKAPAVHGWVFDMESGLIREVELPLEKWRAKGLI